VHSKADAIIAEAKRMFEPVLPRSPNTKTSFGTDGKKQGCQKGSERESAVVIPPRGKLHTDATMVLLSPSRSLVLEAVLSVIGGEFRASGSDPV
jgi:hypothetical protein